MLEALVPGLFVDQSRPSTVNHTIATAGGPVNNYVYVQRLYEVKYERRWRDVGFLCVFVAGFQTFHLLANRFLLHIDR